MSAFASGARLRSLQILDEARLEFGVVGLAEVQGSGEDGVAFRGATGIDEDLAEDGLDLGGVRGLLGSSLCEVKRLRELVFASCGSSSNTCLPPLPILPSAHATL